MYRYGLKNLFLKDKSMPEILNGIYKSAGIRFVKNTFFDIKYGKWINSEDPVHQFERLYGY